MIDNATLAFERLMPLEDEGLEFWYLVEKYYAKANCLITAIKAAQEDTGLYDLNDRLWEEMQRECCGSGEECDIPKIDLFSPGSGTWQHHPSSYEQHFEILYEERSGDGTYNSLD